MIGTLLKTNDRMDFLATWVVGGTSNTELPNLQYCCTDILQPREALAMRSKTSMCEHRHVAKRAAMPRRALPCYLCSPATL
jgi:hypothetical protein